MDIEIRHLEALTAVAEAGTFARAADQLGYTQSAISQQVASLEKALGTAVFDRPGGPRPVRLTPAGEVLLEHAHAILSRLRGAMADVASLTDGMTGHLRVGTIQSVGTQVLPGLLSRMAAERPGVEIELHEAHDPADLLARLEAQELDLTFWSGQGEDMAAHGPFEGEAVLDDPFVLLAPATPEWNGRRSVTIEEVTQHPLIGNRNPTCHAHVLLSFGPREPRFVFHSDDNSTVQRCVAAGLGLALVPMLTIDLDDPATTVIPLDPPTPPRTIWVAWHRSRRPSALVQAFTAASADICRAVSESWTRRVAA